MQYRPLSSRVVGGAALTLALGCAQAALALPALAAAPAGDNGVLKIHDTSTAVDDKANEPKVCQFTIDASGFDPTQRTLSYEILRGDPFVGLPVNLGSVALLAGAGSSAPINLGDGHYKAQLVSADNKGKDIFKVFTISCPAPVPPPVVDPPVVTPPVVDPPVVTPPVVDPPVVTPPVGDPPVVTPPVGDPPVVTPPVVTTTGGGGTITHGGGTITRGGGSIVAAGSSPAVAAPAASQTVVAAASLPFTGDQTGSLALWALGAIGAGSVLLVGGRRRDGKRPV